MTTLSQITQVIDSNKWGFSVSMSEPKFKVLASKKYQVGDTLGYIQNLIDKNKATEVQITPLRKNGSAMVGDVAKTITLNLGRDMSGNNSPVAKPVEYPVAQQNGLGNMGLGFAEMTELYSAKRDLPKIETENETLKRENKELVEKNAKLEKDLYKLELKEEQGGVTQELMKNPQMLATIIGLLKPATPAVALGTPAPVANPVAGLKPSVKYIADYLNNDNTVDQARQFVYKIIQVHQDKDLAPKVLPELLEVLKKHEVI